MQPSRPAVRSAARTELIINCAGMYAWWLPDPSLFERININGVNNLLGAIETAR